MRRSRSIALCALLGGLAAAPAGGAPQPTAPRLAADARPAPARAALQAELAGLRAAQRQAGQHWQLGETGMLRLGEAERLARLSQRPWPEPPRSHSAGERRGGLPPRLDWRAAGGDFVSGIRDQGACAAGWVFATTAAMESAVLRATKGGAGGELDLSEQQLLACLEEVGLSQGCAGGWPEDALWLAESEGLIEESRLPYTAGSRANCPEAGGRRFRFAPGSLVCAAADAQAIKRALRERGPLVTTMAVHAGFLAYTGGVYTALGELLGYHAVAIIGYDEAQRCFIAKNSWGESWGEAGCFRIAEDAGCGFGDWTYATAFVPAGMGPLAAMEVSAQQIRCGGAVQFVDRSRATGAALRNWEWDFDGDGRVDATGPGPHSPVFRRPGHYEPRLRVRDAAGAADELRLEGGLEVAFAGPLWRVDAAAGAAGEEGDGSAERPFAAIQLALNAAADGDTLLLAPGRYMGSMNSELFLGGKSLVIRAAGDPGRVVIDGGGKRRHFRLSAAGEGRAPARLALVGLSLVGGHDAGRGGAILSEGVALELVDCELAGCAVRGERGAGGAIWTDAPLTLRRCVLRENRSEGSGGAIHAAAASVTLDGCVLSGNRAGGEGGALSQVGGLLAVHQSRFLGNRAGLRGGALALLGVSAGLQALRFSGNAVEGGAGALGGGALDWEAPGADLLLGNCLFTDNEAPVGGALRVEGGRFAGTQLTCAGNRATERGGALALRTAPGGSAELANSICWGNLAPTAAEILADGPLALRACLVAGGLGGRARLSGDPRFADPAAGDYRLDDDSPCLGIGDAAGAPALDLAGEARPQPAGSAPDLGAFESPLAGGSEAAPTALGLVFAGAHPNPFNPQTTFTFSLPAAGETTLEIFQSSGRLVATLLDEEMLGAGGHSVTWVARDLAGETLPSGIYLARLALRDEDGHEEHAMQKVILVK